MRLFSVYAFLMVVLAPQTPLWAQCNTSIRVYHQAHSEPRERSVDMLRCVLQVRFAPTEGKAMGTVTHTFVPLRQTVDSLFLDAPDVKVEAARLDGQAQPLRTTPQGVWVIFRPALHWQHTHRLELDFESQPRKGLYFTGWNAPAGSPSRKQIWTQGQGTDHRYWFPCYDDANEKLITETLVTVDSTLEVLANGSLKGRTPNPDGTATWHYAMTRPHSLYLLMLAIGEYRHRDTTTTRGLPVRLYYYPDHEDRFPYIYKYSTEAIDFMEQHTGVNFPWESYAQVPVQDFIYGAMENTTATIFGDFFCVDARGFLDRNYIGVNVHELTHQWFGDLITHRAPKDIWLHESFATFYPKLFTRHTQGQEAYEWQRRGEQNSALQAAKTDHHPIRSTLGGVNRWYTKGSAVLDMLMHTLGEDAYRKAIRYYLNRHAYENVATVDLYHAIQDSLGLTLDWFFDQWVYRGGEPHYEVKWEDLRDAQQRFTQLTVRQVHERSELVGLFKMPIALEVHYADGSVDSLRTVIENETHTLRIPNTRGKNPSFVLFDPGSIVLKTLTFPKSLGELTAQALRAPHMIDRYDALLALREYPLDAKLDVLLEAYGTETFWAPRAEVVQQLANETHPKVDDFLRTAAADPHVEVRRALVQHTRSIRTALLPNFERLLADSSYGIVAEVLLKLAEQYPQNLSRYRAQTANVVGMGHQVRVAWLEAGMMQNDSKARAALVDLCSARHEFRTRQNAIQAAQRLNLLDDALLAHLLDALLSPNTRLAAVAETHLKNAWAQREYKPLMLKRLNAGPWTEAQQSLLEKTFGKWR